MAHAPWRYVADQYEGNATPDLALYAHYGHVLYGHKATEGAFHIDTKHAERARSAHAQGLTVLHYHFARPDEGRIEQEAAAFWRAVKPVWQPGDILALDCETENGKPWKGARDYIPTLRSTVERISGEKGVWVYGSTFFLDTLVPTSVLVRKPRWEAAYGPKPGTGRWRTKWAMWQFTDGQVGPTPHALAGIGECDVSMLSFRYGTPIRLAVGARRRRLKKGK